MPQRQHEHCTVEGCDRKHKSRGYCQTHYMQFRRGVPITPEINVRDRNPPEVCVEDGCSGDVVAKGLCKMHHARLLRHGHTRYRDRKKPPKHCSVEGCDSVLYAKTLCHQHYTRERQASKRGLSLTQLSDMFHAQSGGCAICGRGERTKHPLSQKVMELSIDHCHVTGRTRGLLCDRCNRGIGLLQDDPELLRKAATYIEHHRQPDSG